MQAKWSIYEFTLHVTGEINWKRLQLNIEDFNIIQLYNVTVKQYG